MTDPTDSTGHWGTVADTTGRTGLTATEAELAIASSVVESVTGAVFAFTDKLVNKADRYWLDAATAYLVPFIRDHPDFLTRLDVTSVDQDGQSMTLKADALILPPMAKRCLKRLSWRGTRTLLPTGMRSAVRAGYYPLPGGGQNEIRDYEGERWMPEALA